MSAILSPEGTCKSRTFRISSINRSRPQQILYIICIFFLHKLSLTLSLGLEIMASPIIVTQVNKETTHPVGPWTEVRITASVTLSVGIGL